MTNIENKLKKWRKKGGKGDSYLFTEVEAVIINSIKEEYYEFRTGGPHFCTITHPDLFEIGGVNKLGILALARDGNKVWRFYIDKLIQAIDILDKLEEE